MTVEFPGIHYSTVTNDDDSLDLMYREIDSMFHTGKFRDVEELLDLIDLTKLTTTMALGYLTITLAPLGVKNAARQRLAKRFREHYEPIRGINNVDELLRGLE